MNRRRIAEYIESLTANRRPRRFHPDEEDVEAMRTAIELRAAQPGAALPRPEFVAELHDRLAAEHDEPVERTALRPSRRGLLTAGAAAAAAAVIGGVIDREVLSSTPRTSPAASGRLIPDDATWLPVADAAAITEGQPVRFQSAGAVGFVSRVEGRVSAVSGVCTHQGCVLAPNPVGGSLDCPCHRASFALDGQVLHHQLPIALPRLPTLEVRENAGRIEVLVPKQDAPTTSRPATGTAQ